MGRHLANACACLAVCCCVHRPAFGGLFCHCLVRARLAARSAAGLAHFAHSHPRLLLRQEGAAVRDTRKRAGATTALVEGWGMTRPAWWASALAAALTPVVALCLLLCWRQVWMQDGM